MESDARIIPSMERTPRNGTHFDVVASAIRYIEENFKTQPGLDEIAACVGLSPFHFQRLFTEWAGTSPKKFLEYISIEHAKSLLASNASLLTAALQSGLSGTSRLHDLFISIEGMTPGEYRDGGRNLRINFCFSESPFGTVLIASSEKGIVHMAFVEKEPASLQELKKRFPQARFNERRDKIQEEACAIFKKGTLPEIRLHLKGTPFQLKVWRALLTIPSGRLSTYGAIAARIKNPKAHRAVGTAIGANPVAFLIPCHRVILSRGPLGNYRWGSVRKKAMIGWESAR